MTYLKINVDFFLLEKCSKFNISSYAAKCFVDKIKDILAAPMAFLQNPHSIIWIFENNLSLVFSEIAW